MKPSKQNTCIVCGKPSGIGEFCSRECALKAKGGMKQEVEKHE